MAASGDNCGYDAYFSTTVPDELRCVICHLVLRQPVQIMTCGHRFCSPCFDRIKVQAQETKIDIICPIDREVVMLGHVFPDRAASRTIGNLKVHCRNKDQGCTWIDDLRDLEIHKEGCGFKIVSKVDAQVAGGVNGELDDAIKRMMLRMQTYEGEMMANKKEISKLRSTIEELTEDKKLKDKEIRLLQLSNAELKAESSQRENEVNGLKKSVIGLQNEFDNVKLSNDQHGQDLMQLETKSATFDNKLEDLESRTDVEKQIVGVRGEIKAAKEHLEQSIKSHEALSFKHIENLECVLFAHQQLKSTKEITFKWVMQDYLHMFRIGKPVFSPIFHTKLEGYSYELLVDWNGPNKSKLFVYLCLHPGKTPHRFLGNFDHEFTLTLHSKHGVDRSLRYTHALIAANKGHFVIKKGEDTSGSSPGFRMLDAPFDDYILNNSLLISCTIHL